MVCRENEYTRQWLSEHSAEVLNRLEQTALFRRATCVALYHAIRFEPETAGFFAKWADRKTILLPVIMENDLHFYPYTGDHALTTGAFGIREPLHNISHDTSVVSTVIDLIVVPGIAFDRRCNRLGRGKGYYDRFLSSLPATTPKLGVCFNFQLLDNLPAEPFDIPMDGVITDEEVVYRKSVRDSTTVGTCTNYKLQ
ncbi:hypothetical protein Barb7_01200 [Bacteroidales bacterium Barb7]|nr:hypothetical protein Barb7_01200 [Bacteroidales bacterium Barb7]